MVRFFVMALLATTLGASMAFAQTPSGGGTTTQPGATQPQPGQTTSKSGLLDGNAFDVKMKPSIAGQKGGEAQDSELVFQNGQVRTETWEAQGFKATPYTASLLPDGTLTFSASQNSANNGTVTWSGTIDENGGLEGTAIWTKPGTAPVTYTLDGERDTSKDDLKGRDPVQPQGGSSAPR
jgi:hypothetical protein